MPHICSTLSNDQLYTVYVKDTSGGRAIPQADKKIFVAGKANIANKHIITNEGVMTEVTDEELKALEGLQAFKDHVEAGHLKVVTRKADGNEVAKDMKKKDKSAPLTPDDFKDKPEKAPKVNKEG